MCGIESSLLDLGTYPQGEELVVVHIRVSGHTFLSSDSRKKHLLGFGMGGFGDWENTLKCRMS